MKIKIKSTNFRKLINKANKEQQLNKNFNKLPRSKTNTLEIEIFKNH